MQSISYKVRKLEEAREKVKGLFVGIDEQIDHILERLSFWYLYPERVTRPVIINLWGPTGVGKTDLIRNICSALGVTDSLAEVVLSNHTSEQNLVDYLKDYYPKLVQGAPGVLVLDEFQRYRTKDSSGEPLRGLGYQDVWQVLSDGKIINRMSFEEMEETLSQWGWVTGHGIRACIGKNDITEATEKAVALALGEGKTLADVTSPENHQKVQDCLATLLEEKHQSNLHRSQMLNSAAVSNFTSFVKFRNPSVTPFCWNSYSYGSIDLVLHRVKKLGLWKQLLLQKGLPVGDTVEDILEAADAFITSNDFAREEYLTFTYDMTRLVIFNVGNLDSIYAGAIPSDSPFIPADLTREWSKQINIYDVKRALGRLFFPEQVARLGNSHVIYPTLGSADYQQLIHRGVNKVKKDLANDGFQMSFDDSVLKYIYRNGVYPVQGVRPVLTSIQEIADGAVILAHKSAAHSSGLGHVTYDTEYGRLLLMVNDVLFETPMRGDRDRVAMSVKKNTQMLSRVAAHEAGHALLAYLYCNEVPLFSVVSGEGEGVTLSNAYGDGGSFADEWGIVVRQLGGMEATRIVSGSSTTGGDADLAAVAERLCNMVRRRGMGPQLFRFLNNHGAMLSSYFGLQLSALVNMPYRVHGESGMAEGNLIADMAEDRELLRKAFSAAILMARDTLEIYKDVLQTITSILCEELFISQEQFTAIFGKYQVVKGLKYEEVRVSLEKSCL